MAGKLRDDKGETELCKRLKSQQATECVVVALKFRRQAGGDQQQRYRRRHQTPRPCQERERNIPVDLGAAQQTPKEPNLVWHRRGCARE